jgi:COMPASS component SWD1
VEHHVFIWDKLQGMLVKMLEGPRETVLDVAWHPYLPMLATTSTVGNVYVWNVVREQKYNAFDPSFVDIDDNMDYHEREDEFDIVEHLTVKTKAHATLEDEELDVWTCDAGTSPFLLPMHLDEEHAHLSTQKNSFSK